MVPIEAGVTDSNRRNVMRPRRRVIMQMAWPSRALKSRRNPAALDAASRPRHGAAICEIKRLI